MSYSGSGSGAVSNPLGVARRTSRRVTRRGNRRYHRREHPHRKEMGMKDAKVRLIHNIAGAPDVDVYINNKLVASDVTYKDVSDYLSLPEGTHTIDLYVAGTRDNILTRKANVESCSAYTLLVSGDANKPETFSILPLADDTDMPGPGKAKVRFVHDAAGAPAVDVYYRAYDGDMLLLDNYSYKDYTREYLEIDAAPLTLTVTGAGSNIAVIEPFDISPESGKVYTLVATGTVDNVRFLLSAIVSEDKRACVYRY